MRKASSGRTAKAKEKKMHSPGISEFSIEVEEDWQLNL